MAESQYTTTVSLVVAALAKRRLAKKLSMNVVAQKAGLSHSTVSLIERGLRNPTLDVLLRIAGAIGVELGPIITRAERGTGD